MSLYNQSQCNMFEVSTLNTRITNKLKLIQIQVIYYHMAFIIKWPCYMGNTLLAWPLLCCHPQASFNVLDETFDLESCLGRSMHLLATLLVTLCKYSLLYFRHIVVIKWWTWSATILVSDRLWHLNNANLGLNCARKDPPHCYHQSEWLLQGRMAFMLSFLLFAISIIHCPNLMNSCKLYPQFPVLSWQKCCSRKFDVLSIQR